MSSDSSHSTAGLPQMGVAALLVLLAGVFVVQQQPWQSSRPETVSVETKLYAPPAVQDIDARLWQDPFVAVSRHLEKNKGKQIEGGGNPTDNATAAKPVALPDSAAGKGCGAVLALDADNPGLSQLSSEICRRGQDKPVKYDAIPVLAVMVQGGNYGESQETRRRTRYAVISGIMAFDYKPEDPEHIGAVSGGKGMPERIPFEWFKNRDNDLSSPDLLVLWLDEDAMMASGDGRRGILERIRDLKEKLSSSTIPVNLKVIGPGTSDGLRNLTDELQAPGSSVIAEQTSKDIQFYSASATVAESRLQPWPKSGNTWLPHFLIRTTGTDDKLIGALLGELRLRGVDPICDKHGDKCFGSGHLDHIALIGEWDTFYGQSLRRIIREEATKHCNSHDYEGKSLEDRNAACRHPDWVHRYSYFRGLDGQLAATSPASAKSQDKDKKTEQSVKNIEQADGNPQTDYLRRLAATIKREDESLRQKDIRSGIKAIGIFGTDPYDKLLVLQALRPQFPSAFFFTTDLDARLLHPAESPWARNLIVTSNFGLQLDRGLQKDAPPFRDSYQTAFFLTTQIVLHNLANPGRQITQETISKWLTPRIFEVARNEAYDYRPYSSQEPCENLLGCTDIHPRRPLWTPISRYAINGTLLAAGCLVAIFLFVSPARRFLQDMAKGYVTFRDFYPRLAKTLALVGLAGILALSIICLLEMREVNSEPFSLKGVSVWPTEILRILAGILAGCFLLVAWVDIKANNRKIEKRFFHDLPLTPKAPNLLTERNSVPLFRRFRFLNNSTLLQFLTGISLERWRRAGTPNAVVFMHGLWDEYLYLGCFRFRIARTVRMAVVFLVFGMLLFSMFSPPQVPARGDLVRDLDRFALYFSILSFLLLTFFVMDAIRLCDALVHRMCEGKTDWPDPIVDEYKNLFRVEKENLDEWLDIQLIVDLTKVVGRLIYYPFIVLLVIVLARSPIFDYWPLHPAIVTMWIGSALLAALSAMILQKAAEHSRKVAIETLGRKINQLQADDSSHTALRLKYMMQEIKDLKEGAFLLFTQQPLVRALLLPLGGAGGVAFLEYVLVFTS